MSEDKQIRSAFTFLPDMALELVAWVKAAGGTVHKTERIPCSQSLHRYVSMREALAAVETSRSRAVRA